MYVLTEWKLSSVGDVMTANGYCYGNPRFPEGEYIHTSAVEKTAIDDKERCLYIFTYSGSHYLMGFEEISEKDSACTKAACKRRGISVDIRACLALKQKKEEERKADLSDILIPGDLYVRMAGGKRTICAYLKDHRGIASVPVNVHAGMICDSVLIGEPGVCDWRYFPYGTHIKCCRWSSEVRALLIENIGKDFIFGDLSDGIPCKHGKVTRIEREGCRL